MVLFPVPAYFHYFLVIKIERFINTKIIKELVKQNIEQALVHCMGLKTGNNVTIITDE